MKHYRVLLLYFSVAVALVSASAPAMADPIDPVTLAAAALASTHVAALQNVDGGWVPVVGDLDCGAGCLYGDVAYGLVAAYNFKRFAVLKPGAIATLTTANTLVAGYDAAPGCDLDRPTSDAAFLLSVGSLSGDPKYARVGKALLACVHGAFVTGPDRADALIATKGAAGAADAAFDFVAGFKTAKNLDQRYALAEAQRIIARRADWDDPDCLGCVLRAKGVLLHVYTPRAGSFTAADRVIMKGWVSDLLAAQNLTPGPSYGSWLGDTATTAHALLGLFVQSGVAIEELGKLGVQFIHSLQGADGSIEAGLSDATESIVTDAAAVWGMASEH
jgi:hypothetical protein